ncbi:MAG: 16S rRNA (uracil(1498)-N(3))-methyltransferase [Rhodospirillaceae bacterium]|nr:16S rRNA (uracil(1498)-N(3))-methyltransferase [Rhodospirillaceae bacterium]
MTKSPPRLFVNCSLTIGSIISLQKPQIHYLKNVLRLQSGSLVFLFNGRDGEWSGSLATERNLISVKVEKLQRPQHDSSGPGLLFAPIKKGPMEVLSQKATELGVSTLLPTITDFTDVIKSNYDRFRTIAVEAAEQCDRLTVPLIEPPKKLNERLQVWPENTKLLFAAESGSAKPIDAALRDVKGKNIRMDWVLAVGPAGGFSPAEHEILRGLSYAIPVGLGPRLLKAETAAIAALSCWQSILGDWKKRPIDRNGE